MPLIAAESPRGFWPAWPAAARRDCRLGGRPAGGHGPSEAIFILQLVVLMLVGRLLGEALLRLKQPAVMGQLMAGLVLGPSLLGALFPDMQHALFPAAKEQKAMLDAVSQFGVLLILLMTGMETDLKLVKQSSRASISASICGIIIPFACGFALGEFLPDCDDRRSEQAADHLAVSRHRAVDRLGEDRRHRGPRDELHAPHRRPGDPRLGDRRRHASAGSSSR